MLRPTVHNSDIHVFHTPGMEQCSGNTTSDSASTVSTCIVNFREFVGPGEKRFSSWYTQEKFQGEYFSLTKTNCPKK